MTSNEGASDIYFLQKPDIAIEPVPPITPEAIKLKLTALSGEIKALSWDNLEGAEEDVRRIKELLEEIDADLIGARHRRLFSGEKMPDWTIEVWQIGSRYDGREKEENGSNMR